MSVHIAARHATTTKVSSTPFICNQCRHATLLRRPHRPYTFTQLITLSDGSTFTHRTTSPLAVYRSTRDTRNAPMWNPSSEKLLNVEEDEAGRLAAFRNRFGRGWDSATSGAAAQTPETKDTKEDTQSMSQQQSAIEFEDEGEDDNLLDLISSFGQEQQGGGKKGGK